MEQAVISWGPRAIVRRVDGMKGCGYGARVLLQLLLGAILCTAWANLPPVVDAGPDRDSVRINHIIALVATVEDDLTPVDSLSLLWTQVSGPAVAEIINPHSTITRVIFSKTGVYIFSLKVSDGELSGIDSIRISVIDSIPFLILTPQNNGEIPIGMPYVIRWQIDQNKACDVYYSLDSGLTWVELTVQGSFIDSFVWDVNPSFADSNRYGLLKVEEYQKPAHYTTISFVLVDKSGVWREGEGKEIRIIRQRPDINITRVVSLYGTSSIHSMRHVVYDVCGRRLTDALHCNCPVRHASNRRRR